MAFTISRSESTLNEREEENVEKLGEKECGTREGVISSQLQLKSAKACSESMDKQAVLQRIRQRRSYNKAKTTLEALTGSSEGNNNATALEQRWLQFGDCFSSP